MGYHMTRGSFDRSQLEDDAILVLINTLSPQDTLTIITCVSFLDEHLRLVLQSLMRRKSKVTKKLLNPSGGVVGGFSQKVDLLYALRIIEKQVYKELIRIAEIRNIVAHSHLRVGFDDPNVQDACSKLVIPDGERLSEAAAAFVPVGDPSTQDIARGKFRVSVVCIWQYLRELVISSGNPDA